MNIDDVLKSLYSVQPTPISQQAIRLTENFRAGMLNEIEYKELIADLTSQHNIQESAHSEEERILLNQVLTAVVAAGSLLA